MQEFGYANSVNDLSLDTQVHGEKYEASFGKITDGDTGARYLGARYSVVPAGKRAWPFHNHHANDEMFIVMEGEGILRFGDDEYRLKPGDVAVCPTGGTETAHQIIGTGANGIKYFAVSSMREPDIGEYPETGKLGVFAGTPPGGDQAGRTISKFIDGGAEVGYWDGED